MSGQMVPVEQLGWKNIGGRTWMLPNGSYYTFPEGVDQVAPRSEHRAG